MYEEKHTAHFQGCYFWVDAQVLGYGILKKMVQGKDTMNNKKSPPCRRLYHGRCSFSMDFCASSSYCCCIIVASSPSLMIICPFSSRLCTFSSSSCCSTKARWESLYIVVLSYGGIEMAIGPIISEERWSTICSERIYCNLFLTVSFETFPPHAATMRREIDLVYGYMVRNVNVNIDLCFSLCCELVGWLNI